jgi:hypothetical protein
MRLFICVVASLFLGAGLTQAQSSSPMPSGPGSATTTPVVQRDPQAVAVIQQAFAAMGGQAAIAQIQTVLAQGAIGPTQGSDIRGGNFTWKDQFSPQGHEFRSEFQSGGQTEVFASGHGTPGWMHHGHVKTFTPHVANAELPIHLPAVILATRLANPNYSMTLAGQTQLNGQPAIRVHFTIDSDIVQETLGVEDWFFDPASGLPLRIEYRVPDTFDALKFVPAAAEYSNFQTVQGVAVPFRIIGYEDGSPRSIVTVSSVTINSQIVSSDFDLAGGGQ